MLQTETRRMNWSSERTTDFHLNCSLSRLPDLIGNRRSFVVADRVFWDHHGNSLPFSADYLFQSSETNKSLAQVTPMFHQLQSVQADRHTCLVALGGGITTDMGAFVASTYMRGMPLILCPTTLLAQVDAAIGGKTGFNFNSIKNGVGSFYQPDHVVIDPGVLDTLPEAQLRNGLAECIKHATIADPVLFSQLESEEMSLDSLLQDPVALISRSVTVKLDIVRRDERESGIRRILNFGHTFGHAIELGEGLLHGEGVAVGMVIAGALSEKLGIADQDIVHRLTRILTRWQLPVQTKLDAAEMLKAIHLDKKKRDDVVSLVLLKQIGHPVIHDVSISSLEEELHDLCQHW